MGRPGPEALGLWSYGWGAPEALRWGPVMRLLPAAAAALALLPLSRPAYAADDAVAVSSPAAPAAPAAATTTPHPSPDATDWFAGPLAPHLMAWDMDDRGLERWPFDPRDGYLNGATHQVWVKAGHQFTEGGREANHIAAGLRLSLRLSGDFEYSKFRAGAFRFDRAPDWLSAHGTADLSVNDRDTVEYGFGFATLQGDQSLWGASLELRYERKLAAPWTAYLKYAPAFLSDGRFWHEMSAGIGPSWKRVGVEAAYRALLNPLRNSYGPEVSLRLWL